MALRERRKQNRTGDTTRAARAMPSPSDKAHRDLDKIERNIAPVNKQLERHKKKRASSAKSNPAKQQSKERKKYEMKKKASYIHFLMAKGLPGKILKHVAREAKFENNNWICVLKAGELETLLVGNEGNKQSLINSCIYRLQKQGWFLEKISDNGGGRTVIIDPALYGLDKSNNIH